MVCSVHLSKASCCPFNFQVYVLTQCRFTVRTSALPYYSVGQAEYREEYTEEHYGYKVFLMTVTVTGVENSGSVRFLLHLSGLEYSTTVVVGKCSAGVSIAESRVLDSGICF